MVEDRVGNILDMITVDELADVLGVTLDLESDDEKTKDDIYSAKKYYGEDVDSVCYTGYVQVILENHNRVGPLNEIMGLSDKTLEKLFELMQAGLLEIVDEDDL